MEFYNQDNVGGINGRVVDKPTGFPLTTINLDPEFDLDLSGNRSRKPALTGTIHTFQKKRSNVYGQLHHAVKPMLGIRSARRCFILMILNLTVFFILLSWSSSSNSLSLRAFMYLTVFDFMTLVTYLASLWLISQEQNSTNDGIHVFNQERCEIVIVFASVILSSLGAVFILKESLLRIIEQPDIAIGRLIPGALLGFFFHILLTFSIRNKPLQCVSEASASSLIQEHISDLSKPLCNLIPILNRILQPRVDPFFLLSTVGACLLLLTDIIVQIDLYYSADTAASVVLAISTINTMWPIAVCSAKILLNTTPPYVLAQLDKLLSEAQTLDGVLEIRSERFHTISLASSNADAGLKRRNSFGLILIGSISVRVRRDANEQMVLAHVTNRLSPLVSQLTIQILKDEWNSSAAPPPRMASPFKASMSSSIIYGFNKPAAAVVPYQQTPPKYQAASVQATINDDIIATSNNASTDFTFTVTPSVNKPKTTSYSNAGANIARMYKAAGYTKPPSTSKRLQSSTNIILKQ